MIQEYKRYLRSKANIVIAIVAVALTAISYYFTWKEKLDWLTQYQSPDPDISDASSLLTIANGYNAYTYLGKFLLSNDFMIFFLFALFIGFTAVSGVTLCRHCNSGYGNLLVSRMGFNRYCKNVMVAQNLYILTILAIFFAAQFIVTFFVFPVNNDVPTVTVWSLHDTRSALQKLMPLVIQCVLITIFVLLMLNLTLLSAGIIRNRYAIQFVPLLVFFVPSILIRWIQTINYDFGTQLAFLSPDGFLYSYQNLVISDQSFFQTILSFFTFPAIILIAILLLRGVCKRFEREYL